MSDVTTYINQFDPQQSLAAIAASLRWRAELPMPTGNSQKAKAIRAREAMLRDSDYQNYRVQQPYFAPFGVNTAPYTEAEANTLRFKNIVDNMSDDQVNKFERIYQSYPNQSPGFYTALVDNPDFDVNHPEFENLASVDLEENAKQQGSMLPSAVSDALFMSAYNKEQYVDLPGSYYTANRRNQPGSGLLLPTGNQTSDTAGTLPSGYEGLYGSGGLQGFNEGLNRNVGNVMGAVDKAGEESDWLDWPRGIARNAFAVLSSPQQAVMGGIRSWAGALDEEGGPNFGKAALGALSVTGVGGLLGNAVYGDENFNSAWEQTFAGQMREANWDTGKGWFPSGEVAERQARSVYQTHNLDNQVWSLGVQSAHSVGMDPESSAYHFLSGTIDFIGAVVLDPTVVLGKFAIPSKLAAGVGEKLIAPGAARVGVGEKGVARIESITLRGGAKRTQTRAEVMKSRREAAMTTKKYAEAVARGESPKMAAYANRLIDHLAAVKGGEPTAPLADEFQGDIEMAGFRGIIRAAEDHARSIEAGDQKIAGLDAQIRRTRKDRLAAERGLANDIEIPVELTSQAEKDLYRAYTTLFRNESLMNVYKETATRLVDEAGGMRRPEFEEQTVSTYIGDVGGQLDLAANGGVGDIGHIFAGNPEMSDDLVTQVFENMREAHRLEPADARVALESLVQDSRYGPLPESVYTIGEPIDDIAFGRVNGEDAIVNFKEAPRAKVDDKLIDDAQKILTEDVEADPAKVDEINTGLLERLNIDADALKTGVVQPWDVAEAFDHTRFTDMLFDGDGNMFQGADMMSALLRLINAEPKFPRNLVLANESVRPDILMAAKRVLLEVAKSISKDLNRTVDKHMKNALADIDNKDLTVEKIREDILQMTDLEKIIEATLGRAITTGEEIRYGELLSLAGRVGGHGKLAEMLAESGIQGVRGLNDEGTGIWWADRSIVSAGAVDLDDAGRAVINPLKHNDPLFFMVGREEGQPYRALTLAEARKKARTDQENALGEYFKNIRGGALRAAKANRELTAVQRRQTELQYHASRAIAGLDVKALTEGGLAPEVLDYLDGTGALPSDEILARTFEQLDETAGGMIQAHGTLMDALRADNGIYTDFRGDIPIINPRMTLTNAKKAFNFDSAMRPIMRNAVKKLSKETDLSALIMKTRNKWDRDVYVALIANAKKKKIIGPDGSLVDFTDEDRANAFLEIAATQMGHNMKTSIRGVRTALEPGDGVKFGRTARKYVGQKFDRWQQYVPTAAEVDLSDFNAVAQRIIDLSVFHKLGAESMNDSLEILMGDGNRQQLSRLAIEDALNKTNNAIIDGFQESGFTREQMDSLKAMVRQRTSYSFFNRDNEARRTYMQQQVIDKGVSWELSDESGNLIERSALSHIYFNEQVNNVMSLPSTADLIALQRKFLTWNKFIARTRDIDDGSRLAHIGSAKEALDYLYLNLYRTTLLLRPAYIVRNLLEMDVRSFLSNSPISMFAHPMSNLYTMMGQIAPTGSPLKKKERPFFNQLKKTFGMYDQTPLGRDMADYGDEAAEMAARYAYQVEQGRHSLSDERTSRSSQIARRDYKPVDITDQRWAEGLSHDLFSSRHSAIARMVANDGLTGPQLEFLNSHLKRMGRDVLAPPDGETASLMHPVAVFMHEALNDPAGLKKSLDLYYRGSRKFEPGKVANVDGMKSWYVDTIHQQLDSIRSSARGVEGGETPTSVLVTDTPQNMLDTMLIGPGGYLERIKQQTFGNDQRLRDYIVHGGFHPEGHPIGSAIPDQVQWITNIKDHRQELRDIRSAINTHYGDRITEAKRIYSEHQGGKPTEDAEEIAEMMSSVRVFVTNKWDGAHILDLIDKPADWFFSLSSKAERRGKMGPEYRARLWGVMGDNVDSLSVAALADSEQAALRTLSPLRRLTKGLPGPEIGKSHPYFKGIERRQDKVDDYNAAKAEVETARVEGREPPAEAVERMAKYSEGLDLETATDIADAMAYKYVKDLFYDASRKRNLWFSMRYASMFIAPAMNTISVWTKLMTENPDQVYKAYRAAYALQQEGTGDVLHGPEEGMDKIERSLRGTDPNKAFLFKDDTGWRINVPAVGKLAGLIPGVNMTPEMIGPTSLRLENLNFAMSGGSILPGVSPMISLPWATFNKDVNHSYEKFLDKWFLPFGNRDILDQAVPSWLAGAMVGLTGGRFGIKDELILQNFKPAMAYLYGTGKYQDAMSDPIVKSALRDDAIQLSASMTFWQSIGQAVLPSRPLVDWAAADKTGDTVGISTLATLFYDDYLDAHQGDYEGAMTQMYDEFGMTGIFAISGAKENVGRIPSSSGWDFITANPKLAKAYDKYIYYFFPADEGDMRARIWMEGRGLRTNLSVNEQIEAVRSQFLIMKKAQINDKYATGVLTKEDSAALKKQAAAQMGDASEYEQKDIATPDQFPSILDRMLKESEFRNTPAGAPAAYAMTWRKYYMDLAEGSGQSLGTQKNVELKNEYYARLDGILNQTGGQRSEAVMIIDMLKKEF